jgi:CheY-like chemotaxis protein
MKNILVVDDERPFLLSLKDGLLAYTDKFNVLLASNGQEALQILKKEHIDLLVTDLKMPVVDGFQLLAHVSRHAPYLPVIVITAFGTPEIEERLSRMNALHYLEKPLDFDALAQTIESALANESHSYIRGITLATFLQLVHLEKKSCSLKIRSKDQSGYLFIHQGELCDAQTDRLQGEAAALDIVTWEDTEIEMDGICRRGSKKIASSLEFLLMEAFRLKDEAGVPPEMPAQADALPPTKQTAPSSTPTVVSPLGCKADPDEKLLSVLSTSKAINEFAIFDAENFLEHQSGPPCSLTELNLDPYFSACYDLDKVVEGSGLRYLMLTCARRQRYLFFKRGPRQVVLTLAQGAQPAQVLDQFSSSLFETT